MNYIATPDPVPWYRRLYNRVFPWVPCELPEAPASFQDVIISRAKVNLSFADRLRVLFTGKLEVETRIVTENLVGSTRSKSVTRPGHN